MLVFDEKKHEYFLDGVKLISTTQLMQKHGLAPDYSGVDPDVLRKKAERGTYIHHEIEEWIKDGVVGFTTECDKFKNYIEENGVKPIHSELMVCNDIVAGTIDLVLNKDEQNIIADIKTTYEVHKEPVSWQLSIYLYLYLQKYCFDKDAIKNVYNSWKGQCFHFDNAGLLEVVDIVLKDYDEVEKLMNCERTGTKYELPDLTNVNVARIEELENYIADLKNKQEQYENEYAQIKERLIQEMKDRKLKTYEKGNLKITYVEPSERKSFDKTAFEKDHPGMLDGYIKKSTVKESVKITLKNVKK